MQPRADVTEILIKWTEGDTTALDRLLPLVYDQLKQLAHARLRRERQDHTLNTTAVVHEAYLRLIDSDQIEWKDRLHFFSLASRLMRRLLVDHAHRRNAQKRGGGRPRTPFDEELLIPDEDADRLLELDESLAELGKQHPRQAKIIEHRYFGGLTNPDVAEALGISHATVERDLRFARTWLARYLGGGSTLA